LVTDEIFRGESLLFTVQQCHLECDWLGDSSAQIGVQPYRGITPPGEIKVFLYVARNWVILTPSSAYLEGAHGHLDHARLLVEEHYFNAGHPIYIHCLVKDEHLLFARLKLAIHRPPFEAEEVCSVTGQLLEDMEVAIEIPSFVVIFVDYLHDLADYRRRGLHIGVHSCHIRVNGPNFVAPATLTGGPQEHVVRTKCHLLDILVLCRRLHTPDIGPHESTDGRCDIRICLPH